MVKKYKLSPKAEYVEGNVKHHYAINNEKPCIEEAVRWLELAKRHAPKHRKSELKAITELAKEYNKRLAEDWLRSFDTLCKAMDFLWEHHKAREEREEVK